MRTYTYPSLSFPLRTDANDYLPRLWATRRVGWLMEQVRTNGEQKELRDEIVDLGTRYGIVTPYTSYLATDNLTSLVVTGRDAQQLPLNNRGFIGGVADIRPSKSKDTFSNAPQPAGAPGTATNSVVVESGAVEPLAVARECFACDVGLVIVEGHIRDIQLAQNLGQLRHEGLATPPGRHHARLELRNRRHGPLRRIRNESTESILLGLVEQDGNDRRGIDDH